MPCMFGCKCCKGTHLFVYCSHFLSAWGDRMWSFGVGIFLIYMSPESLQLTAIYGLSMGVCVLLFGAFIGDIVDNTPRLKAAQVALLLQNTFVAICAIIIYIYLTHREEVKTIGEWSLHLFYAVVITLGVLSRLTSIARSIAVEKDWIVEICQGNSRALATMTASLRRIDLTTQILAPVMTGLIMAYAGVQFGALFIGGWNLCSVFIEYYLLWKVYNSVPALQKKKDFIKAKASEAKSQVVEAPDEMDSGDVDGINETAVPLNEDQGKDKTEGSKRKPRSKIVNRCSKLLATAEKLYIGWPIYTSYKALYAGLGLACLFMTVLGFDNITVGYAKMQGVSDGLLGITQGVAAGFGILGTLIYPVLHKRIGLIRTGIFGFSFELLSLVLCVVSVWMPGSPFDLSKGFGPDSRSLDSLSTNCTTMQSNLTQAAISNITNTSMSTLSPVSESNDCLDSDYAPDSLISVWMLLAGIVTARFGLWIADLSVTQIFLEEVKEEERGKVSGVQGSLNQLMNLLKYIMMVLAPYQHQFGITVLISYCFIFFGWCFYAYYLRMMRGHLLPHCCFRNSHVPKSNDTNDANGAASASRDDAVNA